MLYATNLIFLLSCSETEKESETENEIGTENETENETETETETEAENETEDETEDETETETENELVERCDGIDNDGDGLIDEKMHYITWNNDADRGINYQGGELKRSLAVGVRYIEMRQDGYTETNLDEVSGEETVTVAPKDGDFDRYFFYYMDADGDLMQSEADRDNDGFSEDLIRYTRDNAIDKNITESWQFQEGALYEQGEYTWTNNTPTGAYQLASQYTYRIGMEPLWEVEYTWTPTSRQYDARYYISAEQAASDTFMSYYLITADDEYENGLHTSRLRTLYLEEFFGHPQGEGSVYWQRYFEYRYNEDETLAEIEMWLTQDQSSTYPLDTTTPGLLTELTYDEDGHLIRYKEASSEGTTKESVFTRENGLPVHYTLDSDGDGTIDYEQTIQYDGDVILQVDRIVHNPAVYTDLEHAQMRYLYDDNQNLIKMEVDSDGDGSIDMMIEYIHSCEETSYSFDADDYDYGNE
ncbi:MAG: hypothetical protein VX278_01210 [Myxococcota bacterium]|nr:hypothetical protein [Myxococcota bacterium]